MDWDRIELNKASTYCMSRDIGGSFEIVQFFLTQIEVIRILPDVIAVFSNWINIVKQKLWTFSWTSFLWKIFFIFIACSSDRLVTTHSKTHLSQNREPMSSFSMRDNDGWKSFDDFRHVCGSETVSHGWPMITNSWRRERSTSGGHCACALGSELPAV